MTNILEVIKKTKDYISREQQCNIEITKLQTSDSVYEIIKNGSFKLFPLLKQLSLPTNGLSIKECTDAQFDSMFKLVVEKMQLTEVNGGLQLIKFPGLARDYGEAIDQTSGKIVGNVINNKDTMDMVSVACLNLVRIALKQQLPFRKQTNYYTSEALGYLTKHIASSIIDEELGNTNTSRITTLESLLQLKTYMEYMAHHHNIDPTIANNSDVRSVLNYHALITASESTGLVAFEKYLENPNQVILGLNEVTKRGFSTAEKFLENIGASYPNTNEAIAIQKAFTRIKHNRKKN